MTDTANPDPETLATRGGLDRSEFEETSEALFLTSGFVYGSAAEAEAAFAGESDHYIYSRYGNPTVTTFQDRMCLLEGAEACFATSSGMAAVFYSLIAILQSGDHVVASRGLFGSCFVILDELLPRWGITTTFVDGTDFAQWEEALEQPTKVVFFESPSNPMQQLIDIAEVSRLAHDAGARVIVDNVFATPILQLPLDHGADIVVYSATKHLDGQGRTLGGAIMGSAQYIEEEVQPWIRHTGPSISPFNAWVLLKSLETLRLRIEAMMRSATTLAEWLGGNPRVTRVVYPGLARHPQHELARRQMGGGGTVVTFEIDGGTQEVFAVLDALELIDISNNFGDAKSMVTHPATTTHRRIGPEVRKSMGITDGIIRFSVGLESAADLQTDLERALKAHP